MSHIIEQTNLTHCWKDSCCYWLQNFHAKFKGYWQCRPCPATFQVPWQLQICWFCLTSSFCVFDSEVDVWERTTSFSGRLAWFGPWALIPTRRFWSHVSENTVTPHFDSTAFNCSRQKHCFGMFWASGSQSSFGLQVTPVPWIRQKRSLPEQVAFCRTNHQETSGN